MGIAGLACVGGLLTGQAAMAETVAGTAAGTVAGRSARACLAPDQVGSYLSKEGEATISFSAAFLNGLRQAGVDMQALPPHKMIGNGSGTWLPIGDRYDNIEVPSGRVCYPGGWRWTQSATGASYEIDDFWILFSAVGTSKVIANPKVNGRPRDGGELTLLNFSVPQAFLTGQFVPHNGGIGPKRVDLRMTDDIVRDLNTVFGTTFRGGTVLGGLDIAWKGVPSRPLPSGTSLGFVGLQLLADAIRLPLFPASS
ncbi:hypothetical protein [Acrocarpospora corrugata]|uniref:hypothetical protein n=1 Tax=Acrocarpospora corrugata TaxID=35763 RepID=UPI0012D30C94|nr:hypothetical protein [Acrocarpospora corrugata]